MVISLVYIFWMYVILFAIIGAMRGWAKELLVSFSVILALALNYLLRKYVPMIMNLPTTDIAFFWIRTWITIALVYFGYQTVASIGALSGKARKEKLQDALFGAVMGAINGYLVVGTLWAYLNEAQYPFPNIFYPPHPDLAAGITTEITRLMKWMPPYSLGEPGIYFAVIIAFVFIIVVYI
ncbi:MAG: CvpA family protein [Anaerolineales bacterium]|nr:CvpA family protein [Anaerolineales bacterium]